MNEAVRGWLEQAEIADADERLIVLVTLAGGAVSIPEDELHGALRRAQLLLAAGGNPLRALELDGRAVTGLASDLATPAREATLATGLLALVRLAAALPEVEATLGLLAADPDLAWRVFACSLLAESLDEATG